ncbi:MULTISPECIES: DUF721 domain-containing protein [unclassified Luteococcus]|uniref:DUF721 domain-containing protein n=1 Tax=unclassified Luteococcus TaxID=2639923 RepID=UPI00313AA4AC
MDPDWEQSSPSTASDEDREVLARHDPLGVDLASQIAQGTKSLLPPPRGVRKTKRQGRRRWVEPGTRSGSGPDARDPQPLGTALGRVIQERGWQREVNLRHLLDRWEALVGQTNAAHSHPEAYRDCVLTVRCDSTVWATSLRTLAPSLVAQLNRQLGDGTVTRINVLGPTAPSWKHGPRSVRDGRGPRDTYG